MTKGIHSRALLALAAILAITVALSGCSIAGKRRTDNGWQITLINGRSFEDGDGKYILAIYDGNLNDESISVLQFWSGRKPSEEK